ncbi:MAG: DUF4442 domain-containing protein [Candidatus Neomarinimicrobiota bacterium]|nr:MAG: DUF4442 domain-containing protein [Candidatus Neomarinimicrobiota bacterium]
MSKTVDWKNTRLVWLIGFWKIPLIWAVRPLVLQLDPQRCELKIRLRRRTRNHFGSMYLGALAVGADLAGGLIALHLIRQDKSGIQLIFKDFHADFLKRPDGDVHFVCEDGPAISAALKRVRETGERETVPVRVVATVPEKYGLEPVASFQLGLSMK